METEYIWKVVYKSYADNNDIRVNYYQTDSQIFLKDNIMSIEKIVKPIVDYRTNPDVYKNHYEVVIMGALMFCQRNQYIDAIVQLRHGNVLVDSGLKNCKYMVDIMRLYDDYDTYHTFVMDEIYKANNTPH